jgi:hypothetical protein
LHDFQPLNKDVGQEKDAAKAFIFNSLLDTFMRKCSNNERSLFEHPLKTFWLQSPGRGGQGCLNRCSQRRTGGGKNTIGNLTPQQSEGSNVLFINYGS